MYIFKNNVINFSKDFLCDVAAVKWLKYCRYGLILHIELQVVKLTVLHIEIFLSSFVFLLVLRSLLFFNNEMQKGVFFSSLKDFLPQIHCVLKISVFNLINTYQVHVCTCKKIKCTGFYLLSYEFFAC